MTERAELLNAELLKVHGDGDCYICGKPKIAKGWEICSYPHAMVPIKAIDPSHPEGCWEWAAHGEDGAKDG